MDFFELLRYRRSTRRFTEEPISPGDLAKILTAANSAPVGSNFYRDLHLTVIQDKEVLSKLSEAAVRRWEDKARMEKIVGDMPAGKLPKGAYDPFYGAPTVIFVSHRRQDLQPGIEFSNVACATALMHLAAADLGLGSVFMWFALESMRDLPDLDRTPLLNLPADFVPLLSLAVGHPAKESHPRELQTDRITINYL